MPRLTLEYTTPYLKIKSRANERLTEFDFCDWLFSRYADKKGAAGQLARDAARDPNFPRGCDADTEYSEILKYLETQHASVSLKNAFEATFLEYESWLSRVLLGFSTCQEHFNCVEWSPGWKTVEVVKYDDERGWMAELGHNPASPYPWCVQYAGNGHYFKDLQEAQAYCRKRGWTSEYDPKPFR